MAQRVLTDIEQAALLNHELAQLREQQPGKVWLIVTMDECLDLASDCVPMNVQAMARLALQDLDTISRNSARRPVRKSKASADA